MQKITPYLNFTGNAAEALSLYSQVFGGAVVYQQTFGDVPDMPGTENIKDKIMHATFKAGDLELMASDVMQDDQATRGSNTNLSLNFDTLESIEQTFQGLSEGATITMPLQDTFWGARFGMLTDRYGINWMFNYDYPQDK